MTQLLGAPTLAVCLGEALDRLGEGVRAVYDSSVPNPV